MREKRFSEEQIIGILKEWEGGLPIEELARKYGGAITRCIAGRARMGAWKPVMLSGRSQ